MWLCEPSLARQHQVQNPKTGIRSSKRRMHLIFQIFQGAAVFSKSGHDSLCVRVSLWNQVMDDEPEGWWQRRGREQCCLLAWVSRYTWVTLIAKLQNARNYKIFYRCYTFIESLSYDFLGVIQDFWALETHSYSQGSTNNAYAQVPFKTICNSQCTWTPLLGRF